MVFVLGASSIHQAIHNSYYVLKRRLNYRFFKKPGLSFFRRNHLKMVKSFLIHGNLQRLASIICRKVLIWYDIISISVAPHSSNNFAPLTFTELFQVFSTYTKGIAAIPSTKMIQTFSGKRRLSDN